MQTRQIVAFLIVVGIFALALGATIGYSLSSGRTSTITQSGKTSTITQAYTVTSILVGNSSTTSSSSESSQNPTNSATTEVEGSQTYITFYEIVSGCCNNTSGVNTFAYPLSINYSGSWNLTYWVQDVNSIKGNLNGSGNSEMWISFNVAGVVEDTLCANATKLDSSRNNLSLSVLPTGINGYNTNSTTASYGWTEVCATMAV